ncbi:MAG TPA: hypothetical protein VEC19_18295 [Usitatibacter sp.]|nr:hypothetical protein [Usitatibacter sp.]
MTMPNLDFHRDDARVEFERMRRALKPLASEEAVQSLSDAGAVLDTGVARLKRELLASSLCWNDDNHRLMAWIEQQHRAVADFAAQMVEALRATPQPVLPRLIATSLHHRGQASKWAMGRERAEPRGLHSLFLLAVACRRHREKFICRVDGGSRRTTIEALYFRALLLDRFTAGNLTRQQVEVLDAWLWEWSDELRAERERPSGPWLRVDLDTNAGLRSGAPPARGPSLYLRLEALERRRRATVAEMHRGRLVPATGCASELRIEDHVAVLDHLQQAFAASDDPESGRAPRTATSAQRIEVWAGLPEILARGIGVGIETGRFRTLSLEGAAAVDPQFVDRFAEVARRYFWIHDQSETGVGFEALEQDADGIEVGDLLGWRRMPGGPVHVGRVTRRFPRGAGEIFFGVSLLSDCPQPLKLLRAGATAGQDELTLLFMPGDDASGRHDGFLMLDGCYDVADAFAVRLAEEAFHIRFNRVRLKGRGWVLAGFELLERAPEPAAASAQPARAEASLPALALVEEDELDPWATEVRAKLLD